MAAEEGSERELEEFLAGTELFKAEETPAAETEEIVHDEPPGFEPPPTDDTPTPPPSPAEPKKEEKPAEEQPGEEQPEEGDPHTVWATKKYGKDPDAWAKAAYNQERYISQLNEEKKAAEEIARNAIEYAQNMEAQAQSNTTMSMPLSAQEEAWVEQAMMNPAAHAYQAARAGNAKLYNAVIEQIAVDDPGAAARIGTQVQLALQEEMRVAQAQGAEHAAQANGAQPHGDFNTELGQSFERLGINVQQYGEAMWEKFSELGEYHPYTLAVLGGDAIQRDLAVSAVYDLVRAGQTTTRRIGDEQREEQIKREGELRRNAASVVTGSPHVEPQKESPFMEGMMNEWRRRGQWIDEE